MNIVAKPALFPDLLEEPGGHASARDPREYAPGKRRFVPVRKALEGVDDVALLEALIGYGVAAFEPCVFDRARCLQ